MGKRKNKMKRNIINRTTNKKRKHKNLILFTEVFVILGVLIIFIQIVTSGTIIENETGQSAFDLFSTGHFVMGIIICAPFLIVLEKERKRKNNLMFIIAIALISTILISVLFEIFENSPMMVATTIKYNSRADSRLNSTTDVLLNSLGACLMCYIYWKIFKNK